jgi:uncharacterized protein (TIGR00297 family)
MRFSRELSCGVNHSLVWMIDLLLAGGVAFLAWRARALTLSGALASAGVGTMALLAGWSWGLVLIGYFVSSTLLSRFRAGDRAARTAGLAEKQGARDAAQVLANGGAFAAAATGYWASPNPHWQALGAAALAASAADTWATEIGTLARSVPRSILGWRPVPAGTSGGVTAEGTLAGVGGAVFVALLAWAVHWPPVVIIAALVGGVFGCVIDSLLGAALQARRWCASCGAATEQRVHRCGTVTGVTAGLRWLDNDGVNALSTVAGALLGTTIARYL